MTNNYTQQVARALIKLRRLTVSDVAHRAGVNLNNLTMFLMGNNTVLSEQSFDSIFRLLGVEATNEGPRFTGSRVHFLHLDISPINRARSLAPLKLVFPLIGTLNAMELREHKGITPVLIKNSDVRIVLMLRKPAIGRMNLSEAGLTPGVFPGRDKVQDMPAHLMGLIFGEHLKSAHFDLIMDGNYANESIEVLKMVALEYNITISDIVSLIAPSDDREAVVAEAEQTDEPVSGNNVAMLFPSHFRKAG